LENKFLIIKIIKIY